MGISMTKRRNMRLSILSFSIRLVKESDWLFQHAEKQDEI